MALISGFFVVIKTVVSVLFFSLLPFASLQAQEAVLETADQSYKKVVFEDYVDSHQLSEEMAGQKQRLILRPSLVQFSAVLMSAPESGSFSLAYEALALWQSDTESTQPDQMDISHSAFVGQEDGPVIGMYLTRAAAEQLKNVQPGSEMQFYALHLYNYAKGPRLLVLGGRPSEH